MTTTLKNGAQLSSCKRYRYALWRTWDAALPAVTFIGLNPSTADATSDDPTLRRCMRYARDWGYGGVRIANLFAWRATEPAQMVRAANPVGRRNDHWLLKLTADVPLIVAAWGNRGSFDGRADKVRAMLPELHCLAVTRGGQPAHPLYQRASLAPQLLMSAEPSP